MDKKAVPIYFFVLFEVLFFLFIFFFSINHVKAQSLDLDEIVWVHDTKIYFQRKNKNWDFFYWNEQEAKSWNSHAFRLFDQPHLVKYIYGFFFDLVSINVWVDLKQENKNLSYFVSEGDGLSSTINSDELSSQLGTETVKAIKTARLVSFLFHVFFIITLYAFLKKEFGFLYAVFSIILVYFNKSFLWVSSLANADNISNFFILLSTICFYYLFYKKKQLVSKKRFLIYFISSITVALTMSAKINGFLFLYLFIFLSIFNYFFYENKNIFRFLSEISLWILLTLINYMYLQPELWSSFYSGFYKFITQRLSQQNRFYVFYDSLNIFKYSILVVKQYLGSSIHVLSIFKFIVLLVGLPYYLFQKLRSNIPTTDKVVLVTTFFIVFMFIFYYARVGFERYLVIPVILLTLISTKGFFLFIQKLKKITFKVSS